MIENKLISELKRPKSVEFKESEDNSASYGSFVAYPYERGFALTIGNSLRRTILSSLQGYAFIGLKCNKINNEFQNIPGVLQDTTEIISNLKNVSIAIDDPSITSRILHFEIKGKKVFKVSDLKLDKMIQIFNPDMVIFESNKDANFEIDLQLDLGRGYVPAEIIQNNIETHGTIALDGNYSPIKSVNFNIEQVRVGNRGDFEKLKIDIETNGVLKPDEALKNAAQILRETYLTFGSIDNVMLTKDVDDLKEDDKDDKDKIFFESVYKLEFTVRTHFFFKINEIKQIGQLVIKTEDELLKKKEVTKEIIEDIKTVLELNSLSLEMKDINYLEKK